MLYARRWEHELYYREVKRQLRKTDVLQSHTPETGAQEIAALVLASALIAQERRRAANGEVPVLRVSFGRVLRIATAIWVAIDLGAGILSEAQIAEIIDRGYSRSLQTPLNENLLLSSSTGVGGLASGVFGADHAIPLHAGPRDQVNVGLQQALGRRFILDMDYFWKKSLNAGTDLDSLFNTAIYFPIEYAKTRMDGFSIRLNMLETKGLTAFANVGHTTAKAYTPMVGGLVFNAPLPGQVGVLDHDQMLQVTMHAQYQLPNKLPWVALTWRYDSGVVAGAVPDLDSLLALTPNQQQTVGFFCGGSVATIDRPITACTSPTSSRWELRSAPWRRPGSSAAPRLPGRQRRSPRPSPPARRPRVRGRSLPCRRQPPSAFAPARAASPIAPGN